MTTHYPRILSIAGSDSGGGAGIQADLKTCSALGCYGMTAITALTAQNTLGVSGIHAVPAAFLRALVKLTRQLVMSVRAHAEEGGDAHCGHADDDEQRDDNGHRHVSHCHRK